MLSLPFGADQASGSVTYNLRFPGQYYDAETGKHYNYFRDYEPAIGRYIESDPIGLAGGMNTYGYVRGNPVDRIDPRGLSAADVQRIIDAAKRSTQEMTDLHWRRPGSGSSNGTANNLSIACRWLGICENEYIGCKGQATILKEDLDRFKQEGTLDDPWLFQVISEFPPNVHYHVEAFPANPGDPTLILDPWKNEFGVLPP